MANSPSLNEEYSRRTKASATTIGLVGLLLVGIGAVTGWLIRSPSATPVRSAVCGVEITDTGWDLAIYRLRDPEGTGTIVQVFTATSQDRIDVRKWVFAACRGAGATVVEASPETLEWELDGEQGRLAKLGSTVVLVAGRTGDLDIDVETLVQQLIETAR